jgi:hypothetical protein
VNGIHSPLIIGIDREHFLQGARRHDALANVAIQHHAGNASHLFEIAANASFVRFWADKVAFPNIMPATIIRQKLRFTVVALLLPSPGCIAG